MSCCGHLIVWGALLTGLWNLSSWTRDPPHGPLHWKHRVLTTRPPGMSVIWAFRTRDQIANVHGIKEKAREFQKNIYFCFTDYTKAFVWIRTNWEILKEMGIPDHLTCLLRNLYADQEATARTRHGTTDWFKIGKGVKQGCILSPGLFNL